MRLVCFFILASAFFIPTLPSGAAEDGDYSRYTLLYSSNVAGEIEPCG